MDTAQADDAGVTGVVLYWRPGCTYCMRLRRGLRRAGATVTESNIWDDRAAAEIVRSFAGGNETVPTLVVGGRAFVNPSTSQALQAITAYDPNLIAPRPAKRGHSSDGDVRNSGGLGDWIRRWRERTRG